jgi:hypothetical protein
MLFVDGVVGVAEQVSQTSLPQAALAAEHVRHLHLGLDGAEYPGKSVIGVRKSEGTLRGTILIAPLIQRRASPQKLQPMWGYVRYQLATVAAEEPVMAQLESV